jgi:putative transcriptional regulator
MTLSEYLAQNSIKVSAFALKVGVPPSTISRVMKRQRDPGLELLAKIMEATDGAVTPNDFLPEQEAGTPRPFCPEGHSGELQDVDGTSCVGEAAPVGSNCAGADPVDTQIAEVTGERRFREKFRVE